MFAECLTGLLSQSHSEVSGRGTDIIIPGQLNQHRYHQCALPGREVNAR
ncbi:hypothetical protein KCP71_19330 [Salmonella enterica subsp. enterica]|nr:hypothetical protein KCP71_19330 [Salmonella enterica subsp. enterica]